MIYGFNSFGYEGFLFKVETEVKDGVPAIDIVGLADSCVSSTRELVRTAIEQSGFEIPQKRILISISPLGLKKEGGFSLPVALSILAESKTNDVLVMGVLPQILVLGDKIIERTSFTIKNRERTQSANSRITVSGLVHGYVNGRVDAIVKGVIIGDIDAKIENPGSGERLISFGSAGNSDKEGEDSNENS